MAHFWNFGGWLYSSIPSKKATFHRWRIFCRLNLLQAPSGKIDPLPLFGQCLKVNKFFLRRSSQYNEPMKVGIKYGSSCYLLIFNSLFLPSTKRPLLVHMQTIHNWQGCFMTLDKNHTKPWIFRISTKFSEARQNYWPTHLTYLSTIPTHLPDLSIHPDNLPEPTDNLQAWTHRYPHWIHR